MKNWMMALHYFIAHCIPEAFTSPDEAKPMIQAGFLSKGRIMCDLCRADGNYFHTPECVYDQLVSEYPVMWLRDSTRIGACYTLRELLSPEGMVLAIQNAPPVTG